MTRLPPATEHRLVRAVAECRHDPLRHAKLVYPWRKPGTLKAHDGPRRWQAQVLRKLGEHLQDPATRFTPFRVAVASGHGIGKSALIAMIGKWALDTCVDTKIVVTANTETQLRTKTWPEMGKWHQLAITAPWFKVTATAVISTDVQHSAVWRADAIAWSDTNTEAFAGLHNEGKRIVVIYDEASAIDDRIWEVTEGALTDANTEIIWIAFGNPTRNTGRFRECFRRHRHRWFTMQVDSRTVEGTNKELFRQWEDDYGTESDFYKIRVRGVFPSLSARQFIATADVDAAYGRHYDERAFSFAPKIITCDPAWGGDDKLVIGMRQGLVFKILEKMSKNDNDMLVAGKIARYQDEHHATAVFIDGGYGTGIVSAGRTMNRDWTLVWFGEESTDPGCLNKRAEMWNALRKWLKAGGAIPPDQDLRDDLLGVELVPRFDEKIQLEAKESMRKRGLPSPDCGDALALSFAYPVAAESELERISREYAERREVEVLEEMGEEHDPYR